MSASDQNSENRSSVMSDLLAKQDQVIQELENLDQKLLSTIEAFKASKEKAAKEEAAAQEESSTEGDLLTSGESAVEIPVKRAA